MKETVSDEAHEDQWGMAMLQHRIVGCTGVPSLL